MMRDKQLLIEILYICLPTFLGANLSSISLAKKYPTKLKYAFKVWQSWLYIILSAMGALLVALTLRFVGVKVIGHDMLDCIFISIIGAGLFLGIISRFSVTESSNDEVGTQLKTIRDFIFEFLDDSIERKIRQVVESKIKIFNKLAPPKLSDEQGNLIIENKEHPIVIEANRLIAGTKISSDQITKFKADFDQYAVDGEYIAIIRVLINHYDVDYIIKELSDCINNTSSKDQIEKVQTPEMIAKT